MRKCSYDVAGQAVAGNPGDCTSSAFKGYMYFWHVQPETGRENRVSFEEGIGQCADQPFPESRSAKALKTTMQVKTRYKNHPG